MPEPHDHADPDPLAALRAHVQQAHAAAEQLSEQAGAARRRISETPRSGWEVPDDDANQARATASELHGLVELVRSLRELLPEELQGQLTDLIRQLLVVLRALVDVLLARLEQTSGSEPPAAPVEVQDIAIH